MKEALTRLNHDAEFKEDLKKIAKEITYIKQLQRQNNIELSH